MAEAGAQDHELKAPKERCPQVQVEATALALPVGKVHTNQRSALVGQVPANTILGCIVGLIAGFFLVLVVASNRSDTSSTADSTSSTVNPTLKRSIATPEPTKVDPDEAARAEWSTGQTLINSEQFDTAVRYANQRIATDSFNPIAYQLRGNARINTKDYARATSDFSMAISLLEGHNRSEFWDALFADCLRNRSFCYIMQSMNDEAWIDINKAIVLQPNIADFMNVRGVLREFGFQDLKGALEDYETAMRLNPQVTQYQAHYTRVSHKLVRQ